MTDEEYEKLKEPLEDETDDQKKQGSDYIQSILEKSYYDTPRISNAGPRMVNTTLKMRESIYSVAYVYLLKRIHIEGDPSSDEERNKLDNELKENE